MQFFTSLFSSKSRVPNPSMDTVLVGKRVLLRMGDPADWRGWRSIRDMSREFLTPWEPAWPHNGLSYRFFCGLLRRQWRDWRKGRSYGLMIFIRGPAGNPGALIGGIALNDVQRGVAQKATLGYWIGKPYAGQGLMAEAASLVCEFAFEVLQLHRVEASCLPHNERSKGLLKKLGFEEEGYAKAYLQIDGQWQDHILWGKATPFPSTKDP